jgi:hypothetical protein
MSRNSSVSAHLDLSTSASVVGAVGEVRLVDTFTGQSVDFCVSSASSEALTDSSLSILPGFLGSPALIIVASSAVMILGYIMLNFCCLQGRGGNAAQAAAFQTMAEARDDVGLFTPERRHK